MNGTKRRTYKLNWTLIRISKRIRSDYADLALREEQPANRFRASSDGRAPSDVHVRKHDAINGALNM